MRDQEVAPNSLGNGFTDARDRLMALVAFIIDDDEAASNALIEQMAGEVEEATARVVGNRSGELKATVGDVRRLTIAFLHIALNHLEPEEPCT